TAAMWSRGPPSATTSASSAVFTRASSGCRGSRRTTGCSPRSGARYRPGPDKRDEPVSHEPDIARLAGTLANVGLRFADAERELAIRLLRLLAEGLPVPVARLAQAAGLPEEQVAGALERWPG